MGFGFGFAGQRAVLQRQGMADKAVESDLAVATVSLGKTVGASRGPKSASERTRAWHARTHRKQKLMETRCANNLSGAINGAPPVELAVSSLTGSRVGCWSVVR